MPVFENTLTIQRPVDDVFRYLADLENVPEWNYAIVETRKASEGPLGVGTVYRQVRSVPTGGEETLEVTEFEPPNRLAVRGILGPFPARVTYDLAPVVGGTTVKNTVELELRGPAKLVGGLATSKVKQAVAKNLGELKRILESSER